MSDERHKILMAAADHFNRSARKLLTVDGRIHAETVISAVARMAGSLMYRSFGLDPTIAPGTAVLSDEANAQGPKLMNVMFATLQQLGDTVSEASFDQALLTTKFSHLDFKEAHDLLAPTFLRYCETTPLAFPDAAVAAAVAAGLLVHDCRNSLPVDKGATIAVYGFVEGTKTAPYPLPPATHASPDKKKPWYKLW